MVITRRHFFLGALAIAGHAQQRTGPFRPDASAWQSVGFGSWSEQDTEIIGRCEKDRPGEGFLLLRDEFQDFKLNLSFQIAAGGSSAILFREPRRKWGATGDGRPGYGPVCGYKLAIDYHDAENPTGAICDLQKPKKVAGAEGQWNDLEVICRGSEVRVAIAGQRVNRFDQLKAQPGVIGFKLPATAPDGFVIRFQDIVISPVP